MMWKMFAGIFAVVAVIVGTLGFRGQLSGSPPRVVFWDMKFQPKYTAQGQSRFFPDGSSNRTPPEGTVAFGGVDYFGDAGSPTADSFFVRADDAYFRGTDGPAQVKVENGAEVTTNWTRHVPARAVEAAGGWDKLLARGQEAYSVNCSVCHGAVGNGKGITTIYGMAGVANYHADKYREMADGEIYNTITNGKQSMSSYGHQVKVQDRWAIVAYLRVLQYTQMTAEQRSAMGAAQ